MHDVPDDVKVRDDIRVNPASTIDMQDYIQGVVTRVHRNQHGVTRVDAKLDEGIGEVCFKEKEVGEGRLLYVFKDGEMYEMIRKFEVVE